MSKTDFNDLMWFRIVAEERNFTRAAARIGVAQSTLSHTIKRLEANMGLRLLTRTTRSVAPTPAGERLLATIAPRLTEIEDEIAALMEFRDKPSGRVRLTLSDHALETVVWPKLKPLLAAHPDISLVLRADASHRLGRSRLARAPHAAPHVGPDAALQALDDAVHAMALDLELAFAEERVI